MTEEWMIYNIILPILSGLIGIVIGATILIYILGRR